VTLIQRFGSALNLNVHFHLLFLDGAYLLGTSPPVFRRLSAPSAAELAALLARIAERIGRALERTGWLERDYETSYVALDPASEGPMDDLIGVVLEPLDFLARLAALVPPPRMHLTRYHGVFAPHHALRAAITPAGRGRCARPADGAERPVSKHVAMSWAQRLKRVFAVDIEHCRRCGGKLRVIASIEDPALIERILAHLERPAVGDPPRAPFTPRAPPQPLG
jgi:hypothetical protein